MKVLFVLSFKKKLTFSIFSYLCAYIYIMILSMTGFTGRAEGIFEGKN